MEQEAVIYYYVTQENSPQFQPAKKHWWQRYGLSVFPVTEEDSAQHDRQSLRIYVCPVPCFSYKKKSWKPTQLDEAMETVFSRVEGMTDTLVSAGVEELLEESMRRKWQPRPDTLKRLTALRLAREVWRRTEQSSAPANQTAGRVTQKESIYPAKAVVLLGDVQDIDRQMQMTWELFQPYLPRLNSCVIRYEAVPEIDVREELGSFLDDYYYEYGLVVQTERYGEKAKALPPISGQTDTYCLNLDFRKNNLYHSAVKYLDTIVKNSYYE